MVGTCGMSRWRPIGWLTVGILAVWGGVAVGLFSVRVGPEDGGQAGESSDSPPVAADRIPGYTDGSGEFRRLFERWLPWPTSELELRLVREYGAPIAAADETVMRPTRLIFLGAEALDSFQASLPLDSTWVGRTYVVLQRVALRDFVAARQAAARLGLTLSPRGARAASTRRFEESYDYWTVRVRAGLERMVRERALTQGEVDSILRLPLRSHVSAVLDLESRGFLFGMGALKPILRSAAAPGGSQHQVGYAIDVEEHADSRLRRVLAAEGFWQTVAQDEPHFTYLGPSDSATLIARGLSRVQVGGRVYWVPPTLR